MPTKRKKKIDSISDIQDIDEIFQYFNILMNMNRLFMDSPKKLKL
jgi:hypothetical protein